MLYDIRLRITYTYTGQAGSGRHVLRLVPADMSGEQRLVAADLEIDPSPSEQTRGLDFFGNTQVDILHVLPHDEIGFAIRARVQKIAPAQVTATPPLLKDLLSQIEGHRGLEPQSPLHYIGATPMVPIHDEVTSYAMAQINPEMNVMDMITAIGQAIHSDMTFDPAATTVETPLLDAFNARGGVCQDFSHIMIAALRGVGVPAGYVSGYLRTIPPPGQPRLEGADAMHAWVRVWCGDEIGWIEYDPTNAVFAGTDHIIVARGRDYSDVAPVKGVLRLSGEQESEQAVDVIPVEKAS